ncbi:hypothetical protein V8E54_007140 [Elaphomyces granulatus]
MSVIKLAFAGFLRMAEFTCESKALENRTVLVFEHTKLQRHDVTFAKSEYGHTGVEIVVARASKATCPVTTLRALYTLNRLNCRELLYIEHKWFPLKKQVYQRDRKRLRNQGYIEEP